MIKGLQKKLGGKKTPVTVGKNNIKYLSVTLAKEVKEYDFFVQAQHIFLFLSFLWREEGLVLYPGSYE